MLNEIIVLRVIFTPVSAGKAFDALQLLPILSINPAIPTDSEVIGRSASPVD